MNFTIKQKSIFIIIIYLILFICGYILYFYNISRETLWFDEAFTDAITNHSFIDIIKITSKDVHPPLYYLMIKIIKLLFGNSEFVLRAFSAIGGLALAGLGIYPLRKISGNKIGFIFSLLVFIIPIFSAMAKDARMYTWACFFTTGCLLFGYLAVIDGNNKYWITFCFLGIAACYTHNYGLMASVLIYLTIMVYLFINDKNKLFPFFIAAGINIILYLPWLIKLTNQISILNKSGFWIENINIYIIKNVLSYPFFNKFSYPTANLFSLVCTLIIFIITIIGIVISIFKKEKNVKLSIFSFGIYLLTLISSITFSFLIRPILNPRFTFVIVGLLFISVAYGISMLKNNILISIVCILVVSLSIPQLIDNYKLSYNGPMKEIKKFINPKIEQDDVFLHSSTFVFGVFSYYYPKNKHFLYLPDGNPNLCNYDAFNPVGIKGDSYKEFVSSRKRIWLTEHIGVNNFMISDQAMINYGAMKKIIDKAKFMIPESWFSIRLSLFERNMYLEPNSFTFGNIIINIKNFKNNNGQAICAIYNSFPVNPDDFALLYDARIINKKAVIEFKELPFGNYVFIVFHDENMNNLFDLNKNEGFNYSNNNDFSNIQITEKNIIKIDNALKTIDINMFYFKR